MSIPSRQTLPEAFVWRRLHSLTGLWLVVFLIGHLLTNSQAALFFGDDGGGFIHSVNSIHELPYLPLIEILVLGVPIAIHTVWGIKRVRSAEYNSFGSDGAKPLLKYPRNRAFTWQRITSWLLVVGIIAHIIHMRFVEYPLTAEKGAEHAYMVRVSSDEGLHTLAKRLDVKLYNQSQIEELKRSENHPWMQALTYRPLKENEVMAVADNFGTAELLMVRDTFKMPVMIVLYTLLVLATCFHAFNGLWTVMITWGVSLSQYSQRWMRRLTTGLMILVGFLGLSAVWLTYWINLKH